MYQELYKLLQKHFDNVIEKKDKLWVLEYGDLYVITFKNGKINVRRSWANPFLLSIVALIDWLTLDFFYWLLKLHLNSNIKLLLWLLLFAITTFLTARNNTTQKKIIHKIRRLVQSVQDNNFDSVST